MRAIDQVPDSIGGPEIEVLVLGMPRTGTISMHMALEQLGYKSFHGRGMHKNPKLFPLWDEALRAKYYNTVEPYGPGEYRKLLKGYNAVCNGPCTFVAEDLIKAFPHAKVIITTRDVDSWVASLQTSVDETYRRWKSLGWILSWDPFDLGPWWKFHTLLHDLRRVITPRGDRQAFIDHAEKIRSLVPPEQLLEFKIGHGWGPLCRFLKLNEPEVPFPHVNTTADFVAIRKKRLWRGLGFLLLRAGVPLVLVAGSLLLALRGVDLGKMLFFLQRTTSTIIRR